MERAEKIVQSAERCARIVNNFLALARQRPPERYPVLVNAGGPGGGGVISVPIAG